MQAKLDCVTCFQEQALRAARAAGAPVDQQEEVLRKAIRTVADADWRATPIDLGMPVHRIVREVTGVDDPFADAKREATAAALSALDDLRARVAQADDPLRMAIRISVAGNIIDLGALESFDFEETLARVSTADFAVDHYDALQSALEDAQSLLFFADNAGEIVFDRLLLETIEQHWGPEITLVVKSGPFINDATVEDARASGLDQLEHLDMREVSNGDDDEAPAYASDEIDRWVAEHDVVIAKGQANYEALSERVDVFFLLMAKCPCVADVIGVNVGDFVLCHSDDKPRKPPAAT
ncbi:MAG: damage-control phosphatase ARMT1 family protein [Armatimonadota bacterium]